MRRLYEISTDLLALEEYLIENGGEITDIEAEQMIDGVLANLGNERNAKIDSLCCLMREFETRATAMNAEAGRLRELADMNLINAGRIRSRVKAFFELHKMSKLNTERFNITLSANGGVLPLIIPDEWASNPVLAPEKYKKFVVQLSKSSLRADLENGIEVAGCAIGARSSHLRIK